MMRPEEIAAGIGHFLQPSPQPDKEIIVPADKAAMAELGGADRR